DYYCCSYASSSPWVF
nr:immunoglobulin light chain junction region [Macaca mulatta]MOX41932.1 immunoglobulin light chain junction region [Macaca mulatta]MOX42031.1 immunoglobulin light chain junction region [Macaca mulatta]MOX42239.1 immunoglobulin light chain junction region [Macaca mulatta]MOX43103.1 immunoglobulin light chain junction region [Macaca mulatta]